MEKLKKDRGGGSFLLQQTEPAEIFTPEDLTEEHQLIARTARQFIENDVFPHRDAIENQDFDRVVRLLRKAGELGLLAHSIPEKYGGLGLDKITKGLVGEIVGGSGGYGVAHSNHTCIATLPITYFGTPEQKAKYLPKMASGEYIGAYCLTEPGAGSDALAARTTARLNEAGTHYILNGTKIFITNAGFSDTFIVYAKVDGDKFSAFIVEKDFPGLSLGPEENKMGIKGSSTRPVILEDCQVPVENLLGEVGRGHVIALNVLNLGRFNLGFACMGASKGVLKAALAHILERKQFGRTIADFPATKEKVARMAKRIYAAESIQYRTAGLLEEALGDLYDATDHKLIGKRMMAYAPECAICKVYGSETLDQVVDESLQLHGGYGFIKEYRVEQAYRDSRINRIFEGTNEINRLLLPMTLLRKAARGTIDLQGRIQEAVSSMMNGSTDPKQGSILGREKAALESIRNVFLLCTGTAYETFGEEIKEEQETLMILADLAIALFAAESAVLRAEKAIRENGRDAEQLKEAMAIGVLDDTLLEVEMQVKKLITGILFGQKRLDVLKLVGRELRRYLPEGTVGRNRRIAEAVYQAGSYIC
ncbi:MAG: acyl-CoA dehydrogenase family protein [Bacillaceae bacterium]|nr:acyl-CoA dehydrogenase family protein [Bacillaceae bacterium]